MENYEMILYDTCLRVASEKLENNNDCCFLNAYFISGMIIPTLIRG